MINDAALVWTSSGVQSDHNCTITIEDVSLPATSGSNQVEISVLIHAGYPPALQRGHDVGIRNASVSSSACRFFRIGKVHRKFNHSSQFRLADAGTPFGITADEGILYVDHPEGFRASSNASGYRLKIQSLDANGMQDTCDFNIDVIRKGQGSECHVGASSLCAEFRTESECRRHGGLPATDERGCRWRSSGNSSASRLTDEYSTCSTDLATCPDGHCDDLEALNWDICPQDCTENVRGLHESDHSMQGIASGAGICSCRHQGACSCFPEPPTSVDNQSVIDLTATQGPLLR